MSTVITFQLKWSARAAAVDIDRAIDDAFRKLSYPSVKHEQRSLPFLRGLEVGVLTYVRVSDRSSDDSDSLTR